MNDHLVQTWWTTRDLDIQVLDSCAGDFSRTSLHFLETLLGRLLRWHRSRLCILIIVSKFTICNISIYTSLYFTLRWDGVHVTRLPIQHRPSRWPWSQNATAQQCVPTPPQHLVNCQFRIHIGSAQICRIVGRLRLPWCVLWWLCINIGVFLVSSCIKNERVTLSNLWK